MPAGQLLGKQLGILQMRDEVGDVAVWNTAAQSAQASSGARALDALRAGAKVDIVITDYAMPEMTGAQLAREIRNSWPHLPIIMATGYAELPDEEASHYRILNKPFLQHELAEQISEALKQNANLIFLDAARRG